MPEFVYTHHDDGVHEFVLEASGKEVVDDFYDQIEMILDQHPASKPLLLYVDSSKSGYMPFEKAVERQERIRELYPTPKFGKLAVIHENELLNHMIETWIEALELRFEYRIFNDPDEAVNWLLE
jgi:hypothetical protein